MKLALIFLSMILGKQIFASAKDDTLSIAKGIECTYIREKSYVDIYEQCSVEKANLEYIKKISDSIYAQGFKICDPENTVNADKEILKVCTDGCDQFALKGVMGLGGSSSSDIVKCKKICATYSDLVGLNYTSAIKALKKYIEINPPSSKKEDHQAHIAPPIIAAPSPLPAPSIQTTEQALTPAPVEPTKEEK